MKTLERRLEKLEAAAGVGADPRPFVIERWICTPGATTSWLHSRCLAAACCSDEAIRAWPGDEFYKEGEIVRPWAKPGTALKEIEDD